MKFLAKLSQLNPRHATGWIPRVGETGEYMLAALGFGYLQHRYREHMYVAGIPVNLAGGLLLKLGALALDVKGGKARMPNLHTQAHLLGNVGLVTWAYAKGAGTGAAVSGVRRALVRPEDMKKVLAAAPGTKFTAPTEVSGDIAKAPKGDFLSSSQLAEMAR